MDLDHDEDAAFDELLHGKPGASPAPSVEPAEQTKTLVHLAVPANEVKSMRPVWTYWRWWFWAYRSCMGGWMVRVGPRWFYVKGPRSIPSSKTGDQMNPDPVSEEQA